MQIIAIDFLQQIRALIEAAEHGLLTDDGLAAGRQATTQLLEQDWVMPRTVSDVSIHWKRIEECLRSCLERQAGKSARAEELQAAWSAYRELEDIFKERLQ